MTLDYKLFKGISVKLNDVENAEAKASKIASEQPSVKKVWPVSVIPKPDAVWNWVAPSGPAVMSSLETRSDEDPLSIHVMTQVDKMREKGITGKGVKVAVVDTGVSIPSNRSVQSRRLLLDGIQ